MSRTGICSLLPQVGKLKEVRFLVTSSKIGRLVRKLVYFRGLFWKKASQWPSSVYSTIRNLKNVVDNFVKRYEGIYGLLNNDLCDQAWKRG
jgi:hypothetical protein